MSHASPAPTFPIGLVAALAVVRMVMALLASLFTDLDDLPPDHPDQRPHAKVMAELARAEARLLGEIAAAQRAAPRRPRHALPHPRACCIVPPACVAAPHPYCPIPPAVRAPLASSCGTHGSPAPVSALVRSLLAEIVTISAKRALCPAPPNPVPPPLPCIAPANRARPAAPPLSGEIFSSRVAKGIDSQRNPIAGSSGRYEVIKFTPLQFILSRLFL